MMQPKLFTMLNFSLYFFRKSKQKSSQLSKRFAYKGVRCDSI